MKRSKANQTQSLRNKDSHGGTSVGGEPVWTLTDDDDGDGT